MGTSIGEVYFVFTERQVLRVRIFSVPGLGLQ
jgi:hypothetical protein